MLIIADYIGIGWNYPTRKRIVIIQIIIGLTFLMHLQHAGSSSWNLFSINGIMTLLGRNVASLAFSDCWQLFLCNSSNKRGTTYDET